MKKTLAAVLAAAMALSTASVAFAADRFDAETGLHDISTVSAEEPITYGEEYTYLISTFVADATNLSVTELGQLLDDGDAKISVIVTEGSSKFATKPTISLKNVLSSEETEDVIVWAKNQGTITFDDKVIVEAGKKVTAIPVNSKTNAVDFTTIDEVVYPTDSRWDHLIQTCKDANVVTIVKDTLGTQHTLPAAQVKFEVAHTYGTGSTTVGMKFKITFTEDNNDFGYKDGDTIITDEVKFKASYSSMNDVSEDMELTRTEVEDNYVLLNKDDALYDEIGNSEFTLYFEDFAAFSGKMSSAQKVQNMYYITDEIDEIVDAYPDVDFEMIQFLGTPSFTNSGSMTFNAIGGRDTTVYTFDGETLTPLDTTYDSTYGTVTAKGIKKLGTFVVASEVLEVEEEEEEPEEPADETPAVEEQNPQTGAC